MTGDAKILAIETSTSVVGVAVARGSRILLDNWLIEPMGHSSLLLPMCSEALDKAEMSPDDLDAIAVSVGPGSFTGLRIGCATAQGLAHSWRLPVIPVPTFDVLLDQVSRIHNDGSPLPAVAIVQGKARAQTVTALYGLTEGEAKAGRYRSLLPPGTRSVGEFLSNIASYGMGPVAVTGDAAESFVLRHRDPCRKAYPGLELILVDESHRLPMPSSVARVGIEMFREGSSVEARLAIPMYIRRSQAEVVMERKTATSEATG